MQILWETKLIGGVCFCHASPALLWYSAHRVSRMTMATLTDVLQHCPPLVLLAPNHEQRCQQNSPSVATRTRTRVTALEGNVGETPDDAIVFSFDETALQVQYER